MLLQEAVVVGWLDIVGVRALDGMRRTKVSGGMRRTKVSEGICRTTNLLSDIMHRMN